MRLAHAWKLSLAPCMRLAHPWKLSFALCMKLVHTMIGTFSYMRYSYHGDFMIPNFTIHVVAATFVNKGCFKSQNRHLHQTGLRKSQGGFSETLPINLLREPDQPGSKASRRKKMNLPSSWYLEDLRDQEPRRPPGSCRLISPLRCATVGTTVIFWESLWDTLYRTAGCYGDVVSISTGNNNIIGATIH